MFHLKDMFLLSYVIRGVFRVQRSAELGDDTAAVNVRANPMDRHSCHGLPCLLDCLVYMVAVHPDPSELRQEGGMEVDHPVVIFMDEEIGDDEEESGQDYEIDRKLPQQRKDYVGIVEPGLPDLVSSG